MSRFCRGAGALLVQMRDEDGGDGDEREARAVLVTAAEEFASMAITAAAAAVTTTAAISMVESACHLLLGESRLQLMAGLTMLDTIATCRNRIR